VTHNYFKLLMTAYDKCYVVYRCNNGLMNACIRTPTVKCYPVLTLTVIPRKKQQDFLSCYVIPSGLEGIRPTQGYPTWLSCILFLLFLWPLSNVTEDSLALSLCLSLCIYNWCPEEALVCVTCVCLCLCVCAILHVCVCSCICVCVCRD
jgi:hypothetical protein